MELDEMKLAWQALSEKLDQQQALNARLYTESRLDKVRHGLRPLLWGQAIQIAFGVLIMLMGISFWSIHTDVPHYLIWGLLVHGFGVLLILAAARNLHLIRRIDYSAPVLQIQQHIAALRRWRVNVEAPVFAVTGSFAWIPMMLIELQVEFFDMGARDDIVQEHPELVRNLVLAGFASLGLALLVYGLVRCAGHRRWLENNFAGGSVQKAESMLEQIARFEQE